MANSGFPYRGVMLDMGRLVEKKEYYHSLLPHLKSWGFNLLHVHFCDDQFCALEFPSHPELASPNAFSATEMSAFCDEARSYGLEVVPELECFGHTGFITQHKKYAHLQEAADPDSGFTGMCVFLPESKALLKDLIKDTVEIFKPRLVHAGLDEVVFGSHPTSKKLLKKRSKNDLFADHIIWTHNLLKNLGCRMGVWGDHFLRDRVKNTLVKRTPKDVVIFDWHYRPEENPTTMDYFIEHGFEVIGCPSTSFTLNRIISNTSNFDNLRRFSGAGLKRVVSPKALKPGKRGGVTGMISTIWCPYRYVPGTIEYPLAIAGALFSSSKPEPTDFHTKFVRKFWGLKGQVANSAGEALKSLHEISLTKREYERIVFGKSYPHRADSFTRYDQDYGTRRLPALRLIKPALKRALKSATKNQDRLKDYITAALYLEALYTFADSGRKKDPGWKALQKSLIASWKRSRHSEGLHFTGVNKSNKVVRHKKDAYGWIGGLMRDINYLAGNSKN